MKDTIKITGRNSELFNENLTNVLNIASVICMGGKIPTQHDIDNAYKSGGWWCQTQTKYDLFPSVNNYSAFVQDEGENVNGESYIVLRFWARYDRTNKKVSSLCVLLDNWFDFVELVFVKAE